MKEVEITLKVKDSLEQSKKKLQKLGFNIIRKSSVEDVYMVQNLSVHQEKDIDNLLRISCAY